MIVSAAPTLPKSLTTTLAVASAAAVAHIYYNQPMLAHIGRSFHASEHNAGLVATATQIGYAAGMVLFLPLGDLVPRRGLICLLFVLAAFSLCCAAAAPSLPALVVASLAIGATSVMAQVIIPFASDLSTPEQAGRTVGSILSGLLVGILLARTLSGLVAQHYGWRALYWGAAVNSLLFACLLRARLPFVPAKAGMRYRELMHSIWQIVAGTPRLRQVSMVAGLFFAAFSAFWTTLIFFVQRAPYHFGSQAAGAFGLIGAVGALVAPVAGRLADRHTPRYVVRLAIATVIAAFLLFWAAGSHLTGLVAGVILLDAGVQAAQVANQSRVMRLRPDARSRVNTFYMLCYFGGGSLGSFAGSYLWYVCGWSGVCVAGLIFMVLAGIALAVSGPSPGEATERLA